VDTVGSGNIRFLCQDWVNNTTGPNPTGGDSGAPVFRETPMPGDVYAYGILWGVAGNQWIFSNFQGITNDLGGISVCEPGFGC
jgi:hypothetical protein